VSLRFEFERVVGQGPCNRFRGGVVEGPGEALEIGPVAATRTACPDLALEERFIGALTDSARGARSADTLTIYDRDGAALMTLTGG
jgi:heat shock protein HslJ